MIDDEFRVVIPSKGIDNNWHVTNSCDTYVAHCYGFGHSINEGKELAKRISACLNYCSGIPTEKLLGEQTKRAKNREQNFPIEFVAAAEETGQT